MNKNWVIFLSIWILALLMVPATLFQVNISSTLNFFQRLTGLILYILLTTQIVIGTFMNRFTDKLGAKILRFHIVQGTIVYFLILLHPTFGYFLGISLLPIFSRNEFIYNLGRIAFILFTIGVFAGFLRNLTPFMRRNWKKFHIINYLGFLFVAVHSWFAGSDIQSFPFIIIYWTGAIVVVSTIFYRLYKLVPISYFQR